VKTQETSFINPALDLLGMITESDLSLQSLSFPDETDSLPLPSDLPPSFWDSFGRNNGEIIPSTNGNFVLMNNGSSITHWEITEETVTYRLEDYPLTLHNQCYDAPNTCKNIKTINLIMFPIKLLLICIALGFQVQLFFLH